MPINDLIYDVGMNNGDDTAYYLSLGFRTVAIEANPELVEQANLRFASEIASKRLVILNIGITEREGEFPFWVCETNSRWSSFNRAKASIGDLPTHQIQVQGARFETIFGQFGIPFFCKIDIQGSESLCLQAFKSKQIPRYLSVEAGDTRQLEVLNGLGYSLFKCISQFTFLPLQLPPAPEQANVERAMLWLDSSAIRHRLFRKLGGRRWLQKQIQKFRQHNGWNFLPDSSGGFGDQTLGRWLTYAEMVETYKEFRRRWAAGQKSIFWTHDRSPIWADFHAKYVEHPGPPAHVE